VVVEVVVDTVVDTVVAVEVDLEMEGVDMVQKGGRDGRQILLVEYL